MRTLELNKYQEMASRTANTGLTMFDELTNYTLGLTGESGEFAEFVKKKVFHGHEIDRKAMVKELGDVLWYVSQLARVLGVNLDTVAIENINKLQTRYPEKFTTEDSIARVDTREQG